VGAIDPHAIHAVKQKIVYQIVVGRGLRRHGHHDSNRAPLRGGAEQGFRMLVEQNFPLSDFKRPTGSFRALRLCASKAVQRVHDGVHCAHYVGLRAAKRREPKRGKLRLQLADIVLSQGKVVDQVRGAGAIVRMHDVRIRKAGGLQVRHLRAQKTQTLDQFLRLQLLLVLHWGSLQIGHHFRTDALQPDE